MSNIKISLNEFISYHKSVKNSEKFSLPVRLLFSILLIFSIYECFTLGYYFLSFFLLFLYLSILIIKNRFTGKKYYSKLYKSSKFNSEEVSMILSPRLLTFSVTLNNLKFTSSEISFISEYEEFYLIVMLSGFRFFIPKRQINQADRELILKFKKQTEKRNKA